MYVNVPGRKLLNISRYLLNLFLFNIVIMSSVIKQYFIIFVFWKTIILLLSLHKFIVYDRVDGRKQGTLIKNNEEMQCRV